MRSFINKEIQSKLITLIVNVKEAAEEYGRKDQEDDMSSNKKSTRQAALLAQGKLESTYEELIAYIKSI